MRAHEDVAGVQGALQEALFCLRYMNATQGSLGKRVGRHQSQAVHPNLVDAVDGLEKTETNQSSTKVLSKSELSYKKLLNVSFFLKKKVF